MILLMMTSRSRTCLQALFSVVDGDVLVELALAQQVDVEVEAGLLVHRHLRVERPHPGVQFNGHFRDDPILSLIMFGVLRHVKTYSSFLLSIETCPKIPS